MNKVNLLFLVLLVVIIAIMFTFKKDLPIENFAITGRKPDRELILNLLPGFDNEIIGTFIPQKVKTDKLDNLVYTRSLSSNNWYGPVKNSSIEGHILTDLCYAPDRRLIGIFMKMVDSNPIYVMYIKKNRGLRSEWILLDDSENIRSVLFDLDGRMIGCHAITGQIYKKRTEEMDSEWVETSNYDIPMKKLIFDKDLYLMGIGMSDGKLYKKMGYFWNENSWDTENVGSDTIFDCYHDYDGCLIASSYKGIVKQKSANYMSEFVPIRETKKNKKRYSLNEILKFKTGLVLEDDLVLDDTTGLGNELKEILKYKKQALKLCKNKSNLLKKIDYQPNDSNTRNIQLVNKQNQMINNLESMIKRLESDL